MKITSKKARETIQNMVEEVVKENIFQRFMQTSVLWGGDIIPPTNYLAGTLNSSILQKYEDKLDEIDSFSKYWRWAFVRKIIEDQLNLKNISKDLIGETIKEMRSDLKKKIPVLSIVAIPFSSPPKEPIVINEYLTIREMNQREIQFIDKYNEGAKKSNIQYGPIVQSQVQFNKGNVVVYEFTIGHFTLDVISEHIEGKMKYKQYEFMDLLIHRPENELITMNRLFLNILRNYNRAIFGIEFSILFHQVIFKSKWVITWEEIEYSKFTFIKMYSQIGNYENKEYVEKVTNDLDLIIKLAFKDKIPQIQIAISRYSTLFSPYRLTVDKIIDSMIMYEAILTPVRGGTIAEKVAYRGAIVLGTNMNDRHEIYKFIKRIYKYRNYIVHGSSLKVKITEEEIIKFFEMTTKLFIESINIYANLVKQGKKKKLEAIKRLDFYGFDTEKSIYEMLNEQNWMK